MNPVHAVLWGVGEQTHEAVAKKTSMASPLCEELASAGREEAARRAEESAVGDRSRTPRWRAVVEGSVGELAGTRVSALCAGRAMHLLPATGKLGRL